MGKNPCELGQTGFDVEDTVRRLNSGCQFFRSVTPTPMLG
ncbi:hypothetical protein HMPREF1861_01873 [Corynebacterium kroppenstedtii]|nr:hypothetical protein HMPREF1861_01873 [Corynebacterium kroppenstedtii]